MAEPWSVRRARDAGEAFMPARKAAWEDHDDDDASPASRDGRSAERSRRAASAAPAPRLGPIVALVTRRDRVQHVYCKRTNETVPCVAIRLADDTFDGLRVVLWRAHAAADVGVGDVLEARGLRARWNAYRDEPELTSGYGASFVVRATAGALTRHPHDSAPYGQTVLSTNKNTSARARSVASWALEHRASLVRAAALAEARRAHALALMQCREHPNVSSEIDGGDEAKRQKSALCDFVVQKNVFGDVSASDLRVVAETGNGIVSGFSGLVVAACASASERRRLSDGGATKRVTAWVAQDSSGATTEVTLKAMPAEKADALAERLPGSAARFSDFLVFARADERGRRTYALVQRDDAGTTGIPGDGDGDGDGDASWCVLPEGDARAEALAARCSARRASAEAPSLRSLSDLERGSSPFERRASIGPNDVSVVVVRARVAWVRLPRARSSSRPTSLKEKEKVTKREKKKKRFAKKTRGVPATRAEIAASLIAPGCVLCLRELAPDPADGAFRQCACHSGRSNAVGWVWRALELGLVDADDERRQKMFKTNDCINNDSEEASDEGGFRDDPALIRVARVDASLVSRLLLGSSAAEAAAAAARDGNEASGDDVLQEESFSRKRRRTKAEGEVDHLSLAAAAINALAAGPARNATPIVWHLRAPPPDSNGVRFADGAPLEVIDFDVVDFVSAGKAA